MTDTTLEAIYNAGLKLLVPLSSADTFSTIVKEAVRLVDGEDGFIALENNNKLEVAYGSTPSTAKAPVRSRGYTYKSLVNKEAFIVVAKKFRTIHPQIIKNGFKSVIFIPLSYKNKSIGVLVIRSKNQVEFTNNELSILKLFGSLASLGIRKMQLYDETKKALEMRDQFISLSAHELRTPLTAIHGYLQLLYKKYKDKDNNEARWIKDMYSESMKLTNLVNELLQVNHIETGKQLYNFSEVDLTNITEKAIARLRLTYPKHEVRLQNNLNTASDNTIIIGDEDRLQQVIFSLLDNAAKFSAPDKDISVDLSTKGKYSVLTISDKGRGIARVDLPKVFEGFYKGENNQIVGMGVGLMLAKAIIEKHHGTIKINSKLKKGTKVIIKLPIFRYE